MSPQRQLVKRLGVPNYHCGCFTAVLPYCVACGGSPSDLIASIKSCLSHYPSDANKIIVFDKYQDIAAKDHERKRRAAEVIIDYELSISSTLPKREKQKAGSTFNIGENVTMETLDDGAFGHDEADVTMISYVLAAGNCGKNVIRVLSDDTDVFVLLVYWVYKEPYGAKCRWKIERWDGMVLDIKGTVSLDNQPDS